MLFNTQAFVLAFLPVVLGLFYAAPSRAGRQGVLVVASLAFYGYWDVRFVPALVALTLANWAVVRWFAWAGDRRILGLGVALNLAVLGGCKYADFVGEGVADLLGLPFTPFGILLPLGVSFFTFQKISYLIDLRRGDRHVYGLLEFFAFVTFFPQLIAGPLVRHNEIIPQFQADPRGEVAWENLSRGFALFTIGFAKKVGLADTIALVCDPLFARAATTALSAPEAWLAAGSYSLQIYFDFSGYSDMAIGLGLMFGLRLPLNFAAPYRATNIREFWRRWHMTLSRFLRDYLYVPLGGNRGGGFLQARNVVATMLLGGLWHGAAWSFVVWGGLHGLALAVNGAWARAGWRMPAWLGWVMTLGFVVAAWVVFRAPDAATAINVLGGMAGLQGWGATAVPYRAVLAVAVAAALIGPTSQDAALSWLRPAPWIAVPVGAALVGLLVLSGERAPNEFIYFQF
ncbi:MAG: MBOAT family protein [Gemmatimonadaceae bacterium]|nr:MBOAT family protein [Acetobacteraceae bacterium]